MKYIIILGDGMADEPIPLLGGRTPLQAAHTPSMDKIAAMGRNGLLGTVPEGFQPGSEIAHLSLLGYNVAQVFEGRGSLEAASIGVDIEPGEMALRCNILTIENGLIKNHSGGHISSPEAAELITFLQKELGGGKVNFFPGVSYRHLLKIRGGDKNIITTAPHDVLGTPYKDVLVKPADPVLASNRETAELINTLIERSMEILPAHPVNLKRIAEGKEPANSIWPWSPGYRPRMETLTGKYGLKSGAVISAVDLIKGIGIYAGLRLIEVEGATGLYDTNYEGKAAAALEALKKDDFVFLHIEASDEAGHEGDAELKVKTIEYLDSRVVKPIIEVISTWDEPVTLAILPDHPTPCAIKTHTNEPVPFVIYRTDGGEGDTVTSYDETSAAAGVYGTISGDEFMELFIKGDKQ